MQVKKRLIFIRHGQTDEDLSNRLHIHQLLEVGLNAEGQKQIKLATQVCRENNVDMVFCSPEVRAIESAKIIADNLEVSPPTILPELLERNWGEWEGKPWEEVEKMLDAMPLSKRYTFFPATRRVVAADGNETTKSAQHYSGKHCHGCGNCDPWRRAQSNHASPY